MYQLLASAADYLKTCKYLDRTNPDLDPLDTGAVDFQALEYGLLYVCMH
jgi:hypothetical protein